MLDQDGMKCYLWLNSPTITFIILVLVWHHMKLCMVGDVRPLCVGTRMEKQC